MALSLTRPEYLLKFLQDSLDIETLKVVFPEDYGLIYCSYNALQKLRIEYGIDIYPEDIISAESDIETMSVSIEFSKKSLAKKIKATDIEHVRGVKGYSASIKMKIKGPNIFFLFDFVDDNEER